MTVMTDKENGAPTAEVFPELTRDVIDRMANAKSARLREIMEIVIRHLHAIVREANLTQGRMVASHRLPHAGRQDVLRQAARSLSSSRTFWAFRCSLTRSTM